MGKKSLIKKILFILGLLTAVILLILGGLFGPILIAVVGMHPGSTGEAAPGVFRIQESSVDSFLVQGPQGLVLIDSGYSQQTLGKIPSLSFDPSMVKAVFLTHSDRDHTGGLGAFAGIPVYALGAERPFLTGEKQKVWWATGKVSVPVTYLDPGAKVQAAGLTVQAYHTPGHTPGSASYQIGSHLFVGDLGKISGEDLIPFDQVLSMDSRLMAESLESVKHLDGLEMIHTAHYGSLSINSKKSVKEDSLEGKWTLVNAEVLNMGQILDTIQSVGGKDTPRKDLEESLRDFHNQAINEKINTLTWTFMGTGVYDFRLGKDPDSLGTYQRSADGKTVSINAEKQDRVGETKSFFIEELSPHRLVCRFFVQVDFMTEEYRYTFQR